MKSNLKQTVEDTMCQTKVLEFHLGVWFADSDSVNARKCCSDGGGDASGLTGKRKAREMRTRQQTDSLKKIRVKND